MAPKDCSLQLRPTELSAAQLASAQDVGLLVGGQHPDPLQVLGPKVIDGVVVLRCWVSGATKVFVECESGVFLPAGGPDAKEDPPSQVPMSRSAHCPSDCGWLYEAAFEVPGPTDSLVEDLPRWSYQLQVEYGEGGAATLADPYGLGGALLPEAALAAWAAGSPQREMPPASLFGAHHMELRDLRPGLWGTRFAVWAPDARAVSVVGDFNFWDRRAHPMCTRHGFGVWEMFVPTFDLRGQKYGYHIVPQEGEPTIKADAFGLEFVHPGDGGHDAKVPECDEFSRRHWNGTYGWTDAEWLTHRASAFSEDRWASEPLSIYEVHLGSWAAMSSAEPRSYRSLAEPLAKHVTEMGFTAVEFLPLSQYPSDQSWGYQCASGFYAVDSRLGTPDDFRYLVDVLHRHRIAVFMDFVGAHFAKDPWGLVRYSGAAQFEYEGELGELPGWGTARFNYGKPEVRSYLFGAAEHWIDEFHIDGLRLDAVAAMVYRSFGREDDGDAILAGRGVVNEEGVRFLRDLCARVRERRSGVLLFAEESTNFKWVTARPSIEGSERSKVDALDLGFHLKWNMGFTYDTLGFLGTTFSDRPRSETFGWKKLAWYLAYAFNERWVLPLSHDNAHGQGWLEQMTAAGEADAASRFAHLRMLLAYIIGMPGRPLFFMGTEIAAGPWSYSTPLDLEGAQADPQRQSLQAWMARLLRMYRDLPALHRRDDEEVGFEWLDKDSSSRCIYAWRRRCKGSPDVIVVVNASPTKASAYRVSIGKEAGRRWRCMAAASAEDGEPGAVVEAGFGAAYFEQDLAGCAAQFWVEEPAPEVIDGHVRVRVELKHSTTTSGDLVRMVGAAAALGDWRADAGKVLTTSAESFPVWGAEVDLPSGAGAVEFKFVTVRADGSTVWEPIAGNRSVRIDEHGPRQIVAEFGRA
mmetsp:Transcript_13565/g.39040  ORF Transcript_13565/g.39040 Transcript_13565/m.39040 type:complete len:915 (-) Transcript_13565:310-3054(-)